MKTKNFIILSLFLVLLFSIAGAVSATDIDNVTTAETTVSDISISDVQVTETEQIEETDVNNLESGNTVTANSWSTLETYCKSKNNQIIRLTDNNYNANKKIIFGNNATIIGSPSSYITGNLSDIIFVSNGKSITFINVTFKNINCNILMQLSTNGTNTLNSCVFDNITTGTGRTSVVYNNGGFMNIINSNFTNCNTPYGTISNYNAIGADRVSMNVTNCRFENNSATTEPGAINNCGLLNVTNSVFINNNAVWWAGAIHTHTNAYTRINNSNFTGNTAGWNGGALFTYSKLEVYNSIFEDNNCSTNNGGGAIGAYNYGSSYNITIENCTFNSNNNLATNGRGGAISVLNGGYLDVHDSTFNNNHADIGQAICAYTATYENATGGTPKVKIYNNTFTNHDGTNDTVYLTGNDYTFENNTFTNSSQTQYNENNTYIIENPVNCEILVQSLQDFGDEDDIRDEIYLNWTNTVENQDGNSWETAYGNEDEFMFIHAYNEVRDEGVVYLAGVIFNTYINQTLEKSLTIIGQEGTILTENIEHYSVGIFKDKEFRQYTYTYINMTIDLTNSDWPYLIGEVQVRFINCTIIGLREKSQFGILNDDDRQIQDEGNDHTRKHSFENCTFKNCNIEGSLIEARKYSLLNFENCVFENVNADSLVGSITDGGCDDGVVIKNCTFKDCNFANGIVDYIAQTEDLITIEDCTYDFEVTTDLVYVDGHFYVNATKLKVTTVDTNITIGDCINGAVEITLTDVDGNAVADAELTYYVNDEDAQTVTTNAEGKATITLKTIGNVELYVVFEGNDDYAESKNTAEFIVKDTPKIQVTVPNINYGQKANITVSLTGSNDIGLNGTVSLTINGETYNVTVVDGNGIMEVPKLLPNKYNIVANYLGDEYNNAAEADTIFTVAKIKTTLTATNLIKYYGSSAKLSVTLKQAGKVLAGEKVTITIAGKKYTATTNAKGVASFAINNAKGTYKVSVNYAGNNIYATSNKVVTVNVVKPVIKSLTSKVKKGNSYQVSFKTYNNKAIKNTKVGVTVNGKTYKVATNSKGIANVKLNIKKGTYKIISKFLSTAIYGKTTLTSKVKVY